MAAALALSRPKMSADITTLKADVATVKANATTLKADVGTLKADVTSLKVDSAVLKWMMGFVLAFQLVQLFMTFRLLYH